MMMTDMLHPVHGVDVVRVGLQELAYGNLSTSAFDADEWDQLEFAALLERYPAVTELAQRARGQGIDARGVFFAISGKAPRGTGPLAESWRVVLNTPEWVRVKAQATDRANKAAVLSGVLGSMLSRPRDVSDLKEPSAGAGDEFDRLMAGNAATLIEGVPCDKDCKKGEQLVKLFGILGGSLDKNNPQAVLDEVMTLAGRLDIKSFSDLLGFSSRIVKGVSRETRGGTDEMTGYGRSGWGSGVVPTDMLAVAEGEPQALIRLAEEQLTKRAYRSHRNMGKGPVVLLRDESQSMAQHSTNGSPIKHRVALSFEVALADTFNRDGRDLVTIAWGTLETRQHVWGDPAYNLKDHLTSFMAAGGTRIWRSLVQALDVCDKYVDGADILIVTDGALSDGKKVNEDEWLQERLVAFRSAGGRVWAVVVGCPPPIKAQWQSWMPFVDGVASVDELKSGSADLGKIIEGMASRYKEGQKREVW